MDGVNLFGSKSSKVENVVFISPDARRAVARQDYRQALTDLYPLAVSLVILSKNQSLVNTCFECPDRLIADGRLLASVLDETSFSVPEIGFTANLHRYLTKLFARLDGGVDADVCYEIASVVELLSERLNKGSNCTDSRAPGMEQ